MPGCKLKEGLEFNANVVFKTKEQAVSGTIVVTFEGKNMEAWYYVLGSRINFYFQDYMVCN